MRRQANPLILTAMFLSPVLACTGGEGPDERDALVDASDDDDDMDDVDLDDDADSADDADPAGDDDDALDDEGPTDQSGFTVIMTPEGPQTVGYEDIEGRAFVDGDIDLGPVDQLLTPEQYERVSNGGEDGVEFAFTPIPLWGTAWPNGVVYFVTPQTGIPTLDANILSGIAQLDAATDLTFVPVDSFFASLMGWDVVRFQFGLTMPSNAGSSDSVGVKGGAQYITLGFAATPNLVIHELGHAIGLYHEHQRLDRDSFVTYMPICVQNGKGSNFDKRWGIAQGPYDKASIMHYGAFTWSIGAGCPTLIPLSGGLGSIGFNTLSPLDIAGINAMY